MLVKNLVGTSDERCKCNSWIAHWEKHHGKASKCSNLKCENSPNSLIVGSHVKKKGLTLLKKKVYIVPLYNKCNKLATPFDIGNTKIALAANCKEK